MKKLNSIDNDNITMSNAVTIADIIQRYDSMTKELPELRKQIDDYKSQIAELQAVITTNKESEAHMLQTISTLRAEKAALECSPGIDGRGGAAGNGGVEMHIGALKATINVQAAELFKYKAICSIETLELLSEFTEYIALGDTSNKYDAVAKKLSKQAFTLLCKAGIELSSLLRFLNGEDIDVGANTNARMLLVALRYTAGRYTTNRMHYIDLDDVADMLA